MESVLGPAKPKWVARRRRSAVAEARRADEESEGEEASYSYCSSGPSAEEVVKPAVAKESAVARSDADVDSYETISSEGESASRSSSSIPK